MIIEPKVRGFICTTAHPQGCAAHVKSQIEYVKKQKKIAGPKKVLIIGSSTGYGLSSRITASFGASAQTLGVIFEKQASEKRTASAGWYNTAAFEEAASKAGIYAKTINGDAFSDDIKNKTIEIIKQDLGQVDMVIYSVASPRRIHPHTGQTFYSVLKPIGQSYKNKTVDPINGIVSEVEISSADEQEIKNTIAVMGGEDWRMWIDALEQAKLLAKNCITVAYSYIGPNLTYPIYREGTIGLAKNDLEQTAYELDARMNAYDGRALVSINKAVVTQSSAAIPVVPLYIAILFKVMKQKKLHEDCIEQMYRLFNSHLYSNKIATDNKGRIRIDDWEMRADVQEEVTRLWHNVNTENLESITDIQGYRQDFYKLFGFGFSQVDYKADVDPNFEISSLELLPNID